MSDIEYLTIYLVKCYVEDTNHLKQNILFRDWLDSAVMLEKYKYHILYYRYLTRGKNNGESTE